MHRVGFLRLPETEDSRTTVFFQDISVMRHSIRFFSTAAAAAQVALFAASASAHIELINPAPRYELPANKSCPCGDGDSNRRCEVTAEESTDPNRSTTVTTYEAGQVITVRAD